MFTYFLLTFTSIFTLVNPLGVIPVFLGYVEGAKNRDKAKIAGIASITTLICLITFAFSGRAIFEFFSISVNGLRVVGGILFFRNGYDMLQGKLTGSKKHSQEDAVAMGKAAAVSPLGIPMIAGPGSIAATIIHMNESPDAAHSAVIVGVLLLVSILTFVILVSSDRIMRFMGESGTKVFTRLMGLILMMIAVEFFFSGIAPYIKNIASTIN